MSELLDSKYYEVTRPTSLAERLLIMARDRIYDELVRQMQPNAASRIIDVGVSDVVSDGANVLERRYPHQFRITACGLGAGADFKRSFPEIRYFQIRANRKLPFPDQSFDIAVSNAVLEHVGSLQNQYLFVREMSRVAKRVFITVPNRFFPIEHHTAIPMLHYSDASFRLACSLWGKSSWSNAENLILMSRARLSKLTRGIDRNATIGYTGLRLGPFSSNMFLSMT
jgi:Methyltransferase domain